LFSLLEFLVGPSSIENDAHGIEKFLLKSEVYLLIQHILVQDQDGQNNTKL
jgi:hypothetical protein